MRCVSVIPARGGSKGIPRKNLTRVGGSPLVQWSIAHASMASLVDEVIVTTDCDDIATIAEEAGATVVRRDGIEELSGDRATTEDAVIHALDENGIEDECWILTMQPTSPIRDADCLDLAIFQAQCSEGECDSLFSAREVDGYCWRVRGNLSPEPLDPGPRQRRQDRMNSVLEENGSFYLTKAGMLRANGNRLCGRVGFFLMDPLDSFQIDEPSDLARMESLLSLRLPQINARQAMLQSRRRVVAGTE